MIIWIIMFVATAWLTLLIHEGSHALFAKMQGGSIVSFKPWPHKDKEKWWFGVVRYMQPPPERMTRWLHGSPLLFNGPLAVGLGVAGLLWWPPLLVWSAWEATDHLWWWKGYFSLKIPFTQRWSQPVERLDGYKFRNFK
jgi:hypothetical protein